MKNITSSKTKEFYSLVSKLIDVPVTSVEKYWEGFFEVISRRLYLTGVCDIPYLGEMRLVHRDESIQTQNHNGREIRYYVPSRNIPVFTPEDDFVNDVNMMGVTKTYRNRAKKDMLSERDYKRLKRAAELGIKTEEEKIEEEEKRKKENKEMFTQLLRKKRSEWEEENELSSTSD